MNYSQLIDKHFPKYFNYRTLRCLFDPKVTEWHKCDMEKKLEILGNLLTIKPLEYWVESYAKYYKSLKKEYVLMDIPEALFRIYRGATEALEPEKADAIRTFLLHSKMQIVSGFEDVYPRGTLVAVMGEEFEKHQKAYDDKMQRIDELLKSNASQNPNLEE